MKYLLFLFIAIFIWQVIRSFLRLMKILSCLECLKDFLLSATASPSGLINKTPDYDINLNKVLSKYPDISIFSSIYGPTLSYHMSERKIYDNSITLYNDLRMRRNFLISEVRSSFNPLKAVKTLLSFPSSLFNLLGFNPRVSTARILNVITWVLAYLLNLYGSEIKTLIESFLKIQ